MAKTGDVCPKCRKAYLGCISSRASGPLQVRYLRCNNCGHGEKSVVEAADVRRRQPLCSK